MESMKGHYRFCLRAQCSILKYCGHESINCWRSDGLKVDKIAFFEKN
jgi:hypothetical protein